MLGIKCQSFVKRLWTLSYLHQGRHFGLFNQTTLPYFASSWKCRAIADMVKRFSATSLHETTRNQQKHRPQNAIDVLANIKLQISDHSFDINALKYAPLSDLCEDDAIFLISLCGKQTYGRRLLKNKHAERIFEGASSKTVNLFNRLLQTYIENEKTFNSTSILELMKQLQLTPNADTFAKLIGGHSLEGDVAGVRTILEFTERSNIELSDEVHGYLAYALCVSGSPNEGVQVINELSANASSVSWHSFSWLLRGLAQQKSPELFQTVLEDLISYMEPPCPIFHVLDIFRDLNKNGNREKILPLLKCVEVSRDSILIAENELQRCSLSSSAYFFNGLLSQFDGALDNHPAAEHILTLILRQSLESNPTIDSLVEKIKSLKEVYSNGQLVEYIALSVVARRKPLLFGQFLQKLQDSNVTLSPSFKSDVNHSLLLPQEFWHSLCLAQSVTSESSKLADCVANLEELLVIKDSPTKHDVQASNSILSNNVSSILNSEKDDHDITLESVFMFFRKFGVAGWKLSGLQTLLRNLDAAIFDNDREKLASLCILIDPEADFLYDIVLNDGRLDETFHSPAMARGSDISYNVIPINVHNFLRKTNQYNFEKPYYLHNSLHALSDFLIDQHRSSNSVAFSKVIKSINKKTKHYDHVLQATCNLMFCFCLDQSDISLAEKVLENANLISLDIETVPATLLKSGSVAMLGFLQSYIQKQKGLNQASWIMFTSHMKANLFSRAFKIVETNPNLMISEEDIKTFVNDIRRRKNFVDIVLQFETCCRNLQGFNKDMLLLTAFQLLLNDNRIAEARALACHVKWESRRNALAVAFLFFRQLKVPPAEIQPDTFKYCLNAILTENMDTKKVLLRLRNLSDIYERLGIFSILTILNAFYKKISVDDYAYVTRQVQAIFPSFQPNLLSQILIDRIQRLAKEKSIPEAVQFAFDNLQASDEKNCDTWSEVIRICGDMALDSRDNATLARLYDYSLSALPRVKAITASYVLYYHIKHRKSFEELSKLPSDILILVLPELVRLVAKNGDMATFTQLFNNLSGSLFKSDPEVLKKFLVCSVMNNFKPKNLRDKFRHLNFSMKHLSEIAAVCYSSVTGNEELLKIDSFFRSFSFKEDLWQCRLNHFLFNQFSKAMRSSGADDKTVKYLVQMYHKIPSHKNTFYTRTVYLDVITNVRYGSVATNDLCVYH